MPIEFKLPEVSEGVEAADVAELRVSEGDVIEAGQIVMEVETDKSVAEIECPHAGRVVKVHIAEGDSVPIGATLLTIEESSGADSAPSDSPPSADTGSDDRQPAATDSGETASADTAASAQPTATAVGVAEARPEPQRQTSAPARTASGPASDRDDSPSPKIGRTFTPPAPAGPATRRLARQLGVDLHEVAGSGPGGRIVAEDVKNYVHERMSGAVSVATSASVSAPALPDFAKFGPVERQPLNKIARTSAKNLQTAWNVIPHVTQHELCDITELEAARKRFISTVGKDGPKVTMTALAIKAAVAALQQFPNFNASLDPQTDELVLKQYFHIGVAVDTPNGLLVPVVRDCDQKNVLEIAADVTDLAVRARDRKLDISEMQGATFTITNLGGLGGTAFTPIVNYPEVAILGLSRTQRQLQLQDGQPVERLMLPLSLSYDHRVVNGADAARFIVALSNSLSDFFQLLVRT